MDNNTDKRLQIANDDSNSESEMKPDRFKNYEEIYDEDICLWTL